MQVVDGSPFPLGWEQMSGIDDCAHQWQQVGVRSYPEAPLVVVEQCTTCRVPRCGSAWDGSPCVDRRHHSSLHIYEDGSFAPLGGYLAEEEDVD